MLKYWLQIAVRTVFWEQYTAHGAEVCDLAAQGMGVTAQIFGKAVNAHILLGAAVYELFMQGDFIAGEGAGAFHAVHCVITRRRSMQQQ